MAEKNARSNRSSEDYYINASSTGSSGVDYYINASSNRSSEDYYINASSTGSSGVDYYINASSNRSSGVDYDDQMKEFLSELLSANSLIFRIIAAIEIVIMILTLFALCALIKSNRSTPVFVIHLILSDLIQIICKLTDTITGSEEVKKGYDYSLIVGLYFMACVAFERYLLVSHPIWYRSHHSLKVCSVVSVIIWFVPLIFANFTDVNSNLLFSDLSHSISCLIPYPIIILCFVGTCRGLSRAISLTSLKRKNILASLFLVLLTYTFLILPNIILTFTRGHFYSYNRALFHIFWYFSEYLVFLNPLADCVLYMFLRPDVGGLMNCCCRTDTYQSSTHSRDEHSRDSSAAFACCVSMQKPASHSQTACSSV